MNPELGLLLGAEQRRSPHFDERSDPADISLLVVHGISLPPGQFGGPHIDELFLGTLDGNAHPYFDALRGLRVSSHLLIHRDGRVVQYVPFDKRAWHAGQSSFAGRERCNDYSIGIELEGTDDTPYEAVQYQRLARIVALLIQSYPGLTPERIAGHSEIAPGRKTDPGLAFEWGRFRTDLAAALATDQSIAAGRVPP
ncbi:MAG: 1,6-anhydro-N-acetylmuramyl-L-alanine amidase AmpD [Gammaproteobacteria bacterium]|nr:1,6-anhydro-N-acetylmuramyl-L-alanine amidase AmpD [Gammaproteobacteria bacterium]